jgi:hypothetical protein
MILIIFGEKCRKGFFKNYDFVLSKLATNKISIHFAFDFHLYSSFFRFLLRTSQYYNSRSHTVPNWWAIPRVVCIGKNSLFNYTNIWFVDIIYDFCNLIIFLFLENKNEQKKYLWFRLMCAFTFFCGSLVFSIKNFEQKMWNFEHFKNVQ